MTPTRLLFFYLWIAPHLLLVPASILMVLRGKHKEYPAFLGYMIFEVLQFAVLFGMARSDFVSAQTYWRADLIFRGLSIAFRFGVIRELFEKPIGKCEVFQKKVSLVRNGLTASLIMLSTALIAGLYLTNGLGMQPYFFDLVLNVVHCGLVASVILWYGFLGVKIRGMAFGIICGLALTVATAPILTAFKTQFPGDSRAPDLIAMGLYHVSVLIWIVGIQLRERAPIIATVPTQNTHMQKWNEELGRLWQQ